MSVYLAIFAAKLVQQVYYLFVKVSLRNLFANEPIACNLQFSYKLADFLYKLQDLSKLM